ncbi:MAG: glycoside hydrolase family 16 protein [Actinomycetota bacterium]
MAGAVPEEAVASTDEQPRRTRRLTWRQIAGVAILCAAVGLVSIRAYLALTAGPPPDHSSGFAVVEMISSGDEHRSPVPILRSEPEPVGPVCAPNSDGTVPWLLVDEDTFDGDELDLDKWIVYNSPGNAGFGLRRPSAIAVDNGLLVITAQMLNGYLVSGGMAHKVDQTYGRWEFRVRTDADPSEATSGVVLTWPQSENWPIDGENDMYETGTVPNRSPFRTYIHYGADNSQEYMTHDANGTLWHEMAMEWTAERISMFRDGIFVGEVTRDEVIPDVPHHMTIQLDAWADEMGDPVTMEVDWMRVYRADVDGECGDDDLLASVEAE